MNFMEELQDIYRDILDDNELVITTDMTRDDIEGWDSLAQISIIGACESKFKIKFTIDEVVAVKKVGDILSFVENKTNKT